jgi:hypothetical protein
MDYKEGEASQSAKKRGHKSSLSMVDNIHAQKVSTGNIGELKQELDLENYKFGLNDIGDYSREFSFKGNDMSLNKTILDGSVIIHSGANPFGRNPSLISAAGKYGNQGDSRGDSGINWMRDTYNDNEHDNDQDDKNMQTQLNISLFDNTINESKIETHDSTPIKQQPASTGAFSMLQQKLRENASREKDLKIKKELHISEEKVKKYGVPRKLFITLFITIFE